MATLSLYAIPAYADAISARFALSGAEVGALTSSLAVSYALIQVPAGLIAARVGTRESFVASLCLVAAGFVGTAAAPDFGVLVACRVLTGAGAGMLLPLGSSLARSSLPGRNMRAQATIGTGWGLGYILALIVVPAAFSTWRIAFLGLGGSALILCFFAGAIISGRTVERGAVPSRVARDLLGEPAVWLIGTCLFGLTVGIVGVGTWIKVFAEDQRHLSATTAALLGVLIGIGLLPASVTGGVLARRIGPRSVIITSSLGVAGALLLVVAPVGQVVLAFGLLGLGWFSALPFGVVLALAGEAARAPDSVSQAVLVGAVNGSAFVGGAAAAPLVGALRDATGSFGPGFASLVSGPVIALVALGMLQRSAHVDLLARREQVE